MAYSTKQKRVAWLAAFKAKHGITYSAFYYKKNIEKSKQATSNYYKANSDSIRDRRASRYREIEKVDSAYVEKNRKSASEWRRFNPERHSASGKQYRSTSGFKKQNRERLRLKYRSDPNHRLAVTIRNRINEAVDPRSRPGSAVRDLGCSIAELRSYLERRFSPGMSWENHSQYGWHIDHIRPLASFDLSDRAQFLEACHFTNLQPLWAADNLSKSDTYAATS